MKRALLILVLLIFYYHCPAQSMGYTLQDILSITQEKSVSAKISQSIQEVKKLEYTNFKYSLRPQISLKGSALDFTQQYSGILQNDGSLRFLSVNQNFSNAGIELKQNLFPTGGEISFSSRLSRFDDFSQKYNQYSGIPYNIVFKQPLFGFNNYKWMKQIERLKLVESEKEHIQNRESIARQAVVHYFNLVDSQIDIELAEKNIEFLKVLYSTELKKTTLGTSMRDKILTLKLQLLQAENDFIRANSEVKMNLRSIKTYVGIEDTASFSAILPEKLPKLNLSVATAIAEAKKNRKEYVAFERRKREAEREIEKVKRENFAIVFNATYGKNGAGNEVVNIFNDMNNQKNISLSIIAPLHDWGRNKAKRNLAEANYRVESYSIKQDEIAIENEIVNLVQNIELIYNNFEYFEEAVKVSFERYELAKEKYVLGTVSVTDLNIAMKEKDQQKRTYVNILRDFWESYYMLRYLTLYDFETNTNIHY